ncbi:MAG: Putative NUDIX hydrolase [Candidatus Parvarchaeum acidiphilum ARMAN-4_'5-way FS']|jgi:8-oxo-dGTP diphosphatase|uniref:Putative NUDIX hydrolase n=1 Tax=Candidatus Parvarchaeum acidiphilum ARMAN-4_'5-way FS' TaxID=994837 RepID=F2UTS2_PARA4|nr:MAG: Putative NUDIX hydrolase [Candidatus Parvarchaeum acidiphilum ARMAN-4_'5-way FS']
MEYKSPSLAVDGVILKDNQILLIKRKNDPYKDKWAIPGGFVEYGEKTEDAVLREVKEETGLEAKISDLVGVYSNPKRDPRKHVVSITYLLKDISGTEKGGDDAKEAKWWNINELPELAFDHKYIINDALRIYYNKK